VLYEVLGACFIITSQNFTEGVVLFV